MQGNNFNPFYGFGPTPMQQMPQQPQGYPWQSSFPGMQGQQAPGQMVGQARQQPQQRQQQTQSDFFVLVNGVEDVKNTLLQPNQGVWFRFQNDPYIAYKFANEVGTAETKYFEIREVNLADTNRSNAVYNGQISQDLIAHIQGLEEKVKQLETRVMEMKGVNEDGKSIKQVSQQNDARSNSRKQRADPAGPD